MRSELLTPALGLVLAIGVAGGAVGETPSVLKELEHASASGEVLCDALSAGATAESDGSGSTRVVWDELERDEIINRHRIGGLFENIPHDYRTHRDDLPKRGIYLDLSIYFEEDLTPIDIESIRISRGRDVWSYRTAEKIKSHVETDDDGTIKRFYLNHMWDNDTNGTALGMSPFPTAAPIP